MVRPSAPKKNLAFVFLAVGIIALYFFTKTQEDESLPKEVKLKSRQKNIVKDTPKEESSGEISTQGNGDPSEASQNTTQRPENTTIGTETIRKPQEVLEDFKKLTHLDFSAPAGFDFHELDFDKIAGIASFDDKSAVAILAAPFKASTDQVVKFIKDYKSSLRFMNGNDFVVTGEFQTLVPSNNSGLSKITLIPGNKVDGSQVYAALTERLDGKGTYLFILKTPGDLNSARPEIDKFIETLKTKR